MQNPDHGIGVSILENFRNAALLYFIPQRPVRRPYLSVPT